MLKRILLVTALMCPASLVWAEGGGSPGGLFVEPAVTYELGDTSVDYPSPFNNSSGSADGLGLMARLGFHINEALFIAADARYSMPKFKDSAFEYNASATQINWGPAVGVQMPDYGLRIWGNYIADGQLDPEKSGAMDVKFTKGTGYRVGVGFHVKMVSLNLEYQNLRYKTMTLQQLGSIDPNTSFDSVRLSNASWIASVSFPLEL